THHQNDMEKINKVAKIDAYLVKTFADFLEKLKSTRDGDGNLLDHSLIVYGSSLADANAHTHHDLPIALVGGRCGQLNGGRHLRYPKDTPMNNLLVSVLNKAGVRVDSFGDSTGPLPNVFDV